MRPKIYRRIEGSFLKDIKREYLKKQILKQGLSLRTETLYKRRKRHQASVQVLTALGIENIVPDDLPGAASSSL